LASISAALTGRPALAVLCRSKIPQLRWRLLIHSTFSVDRHPPIGDPVQSSRSSTATFSRAPRPRSGTAARIMTLALSLSQRSYCLEQRQSVAAANGSDSGVPSAAAETPSRSGCHRQPHDAAHSKSRPSEDRRRRPERRQGLQKQPRAVVAAASHMPSPRIKIAGEMFVNRLRATLACARHWRPGPANSPPAALRGLVRSHWRAVGVSAIDQPSWSITKVGGRKFRTLVSLEHHHTVVIHPSTSAAAIEPRGPPRLSSPLMCPCMTTSAVLGAMREAQRDVFRDSGVFAIAGAPG